RKQKQGNPFALSPKEYPFQDALVVQTVPLPTMLDWEHDTGGFFVETETQPTFAEFVPVDLVRPSGKRVHGFAAKALNIFPIEMRIWWVMGDPGNEVVINGYQEGARSKTNVIGVAHNGQYVLLAAKGLASQSLSNAFKQHRKAAKYQLKAKPYILAMMCAAGDVEKIKGSYVTRFHFPTNQESRCSQELGWAILERQSEIEAWAGRENSQPQESDPQPGPPALQESSEPETIEADEDDDGLTYRDGATVDMNNAIEVKAFEDFRSIHAYTSPKSRSILRAWLKRKRNGGAVPA
ncbi:MAG: hypothetical protein U9Q82_09805, partial [Chloroflexota bacterium]|nr:hypothetical protein [Chloroflexota bacterium]